jgi:hypothetical protein
VQVGGVICPRRSGLLASRLPFEGWRRPARRFLVLLVFLAQLFVPAVHGHAPLQSDSSAVAGVADLAASNSDAAKSAVPCPHHSAKAGSLDSDHGKTPCCPQNDCPCPCCHLFDAAAVGLPPPDSAQAAYAPLLSEAVSTFETFGPIRQPANFAGRPRGPPDLI